MLIIMIPMTVMVNSYDDGNEDDNDGDDDDDD